MWAATSGFPIASVDATLHELVCSFLRRNADLRLLFCVITLTYFLQKLYDGGLGS